MSLTKDRYDVDDRIIARIPGYKQNYFGTVKRVLPIGGYTILYDNGKILPTNHDQILGLTYQSRNNWPKAIQDQSVPMYLPQRVSPESIETIKRCAGNPVTKTEYLVNDRVIVRYEEDTIDDGNYTGTVIKGLMNGFYIIEYANGSACPCEHIQILGLTDESSVDPIPDGELRMQLRQGIIPPVPPGGGKEQRNMNIYILNERHGDEKSAADLIDKAERSFKQKTTLNHEIWILTCYVNLDLLEEYVTDLIESIHITNVYLAFNFAEIYKSGPTDTRLMLSSVQNKLEKLGINFEWKALLSSRLVHSKGYAIIQKTNNNIQSGVVLITSANFTVPGFKGENIELCYLSTIQDDLSDFENAYTYLWQELGTDIDRAVFKQGEYLFKFALLSSGLFLHKWAGSLSQQVGIKYRLTALAKEKGSIAPELAAVGFEAGDTFTRQVLDLGELPTKEVPTTFVKSFTIETYWGRWCPRDAWNALSETFEGTDNFIKRFQSAAEDNVLKTVKRDALVIQKALIEKGLINPVSQDHLDRWISKIQELRTNRRRLERFFTGYEANELPYTIAQKLDVEELFNSLEEAINITRARNIAKRKALSAIKDANPSLICLNNKEIQIIKRIVVR